MAYAPHTNTDVKRQRAHGVKDGAPVILGRFKIGKNVFEYAERKWPDPKYLPEYKHIVYVGPNGESRLANVKISVAHVVVDEDEHGKPVVERWGITSFKTYDNSWMND